MDFMSFLAPLVGMIPVVGPFAAAAMSGLSALGSWNRQQKADQLAVQDRLIGLKQSLADTQLSKMDQRDKAASIEAFLNHFAGTDMGAKAGITTTSSKFITPDDRSMTALYQEIMRPMAQASVMSGATGRMGSAQLVATAMEDAIADELKGTKTQLSIYSTSLDNLTQAEEDITNLIDDTEELITPPSGGSFTIPDKDTGETQVETLGNRNRDRNATLAAIESDGVLPTKSKQRLWG